MHHTGTMDYCRSPSPPPHFPDFRSTPSPIRHRLPRPLPDLPGRLPPPGASSPSSSRAVSWSAGSRPSSGEAPETVLAIIQEIDVALNYTNSTRRPRPARFSTPTPPTTTTTTDAHPAPPTAFPPSPTRQRAASTSSIYSVSSVSSSWSDSSTATARSRTLRRRFSPRCESLREVRARDSEVCLQRVYERQVMMYLDGSIFDAACPGGGDWGETPPSP